MAWERLFWDVFERSRNAMSLLDGRRRHASVNQAMVDLLGYSREQMIGMELEALVPAEDRLELTMRWDQFVDLGEPVVAQRPFVCADGTWILAEAAARTEIVTGRLLALLVILHAEAAPTHDGEPTAAADEPLTPREREITHLLALGLSGPEVAARLIVSHETVRTHIRNAMTKLDARTRAQLVAIALAHGLIVEG